MIYSLQKKFIKICGIALSAVLVIIFVLIAVFSRTQLNGVMDQLTDRISSNGGRFPNKIDTEHRIDDRRISGFITEETKYSTRYFTVTTDREGNLLSVNTEFISSVTQEEAA
ncbi:MAG: hypothetical protein ACI4LB_05115, partial [Candidatus Fimenecus sp.]